MTDATADQTIFALASGRAGAAVAVIRISGPAAGDVLSGLTGRPISGHEPRKACLRTLRDAGEAIDQSLVLWFPGPASFTGEDMAELHVHGGEAVIEALLQAIGRRAGCRAAEPGEFTRRAFENGKLDLTQAEGIADLVAAETEAQRRQALRQTEGALGRLYASWRERLVRAAAYLEAAIDFAEDDLPDDLTEQVASVLDGVRQELAAHLADHGRGRRLRDGVRLAILGRPNAGKSSFLNWLAGRDAAIVSATPGTTRDVVQVVLNLGGYPVAAADTAGVRKTDDPVEAEGVRRAKAAAAGADVRLLILDGARAEPESGLAAELSLEAGDVVAWNKSDLSPRAPENWAGFDVTAISLKTGSGLGELESRLTGRVSALSGVTGAPAPTRARHRLALEDAEAAMVRAGDGWRDGLGPEVVAEDVRAASGALGAITGRVGVEDLLDVIFKDFCIGK